MAKPPFDGDHHANTKHRDSYAASHLDANEELVFLENLVAEFGVVPEFGPKMAQVFEDLGHRQHELNLDERVRFEALLNRVGRVVATWRHTDDSQAPR